MTEAKNEDDKKVPELTIEEIKEKFTGELTMPSGNTVVFRNTDDLEYGERKELIRKSESSKDNYSTIDNILAILIESWSYKQKGTENPLPIPSVSFKSLEKVPNRDANTLIKAGTQLSKIIFGVETADTLENRLNPDSPLDKSND